MHEMTATLVGTLPVSAPQQCSCAHSPLCMGISYKKQNSSCSTPTPQPCCLSSRIPHVLLKRCSFVSIEEVQGKTTQHIPKITLKSQYRMLGKTMSHTFKADTVITLMTVITLCYCCLPIQAVMLLSLHFLCANADTHATPKVNSTLPVILPPPP